MCAIQRSWLAFHTVFENHVLTKIVHICRRLVYVHTRVFDQLTRDVADGYADDELD
jgi:hypothetical protein